ncbi:hypothetical protein MTYP_02787 [Methylophilaceae bacterium]|nr:hypothetical protein MTYP_02787 [Methylophilaceae bacterium]
MAQITKNDGRWLITGDLVLADIEALLAEGVAVDSGDALEIDMSGVSEVDSVTISLLFEWVRQAKSRKCNLVYSNLPANLTSLATLYGVLDLVPQAAAQAASH